MELQKEKIRIMTWSLVISSVLMCIKFFAYFLTNSNAVLTDALESIVNIIAGAFALYSVFYAGRPKDKNHPYGHGKIEFVSAGFEGGLILMAGLAMTYKGVKAFVIPYEIQEADIGAWLSGAAGLVNFFLGRYLIKQGKAKHSLLMIADGKHLVSDTVSSIGLVVGLLLIFVTGLNWIDYVITIIFGLAIIYTGAKLVRQSITNLLDEADEEKLNHLVDLLEKNRSVKWIDIHNLRVLKYGSQLHVDCHITLPWYDTLEVNHAEVHAVEDLVKKNTEQDIEFFIHADPCIPTSCPICRIENCPVRRAEFVKYIPWTMANLLPDSKHSLLND